MIDYHRKLSLANDYAGGGDYSEPILGERLSILWASYMAELGLVGDVIGRITKTVFNNHHTVGMTGLFQSTAFSANSFDIQGVRGGISTVDGSNTASYIQAAGMTWGILGYSLEDLAIRQYTGLSAASATKVLHAANVAGTKIYKGTQANWSGTVVPALSGYNSTDLSNIETFYLPYGWFAFLAQTASQAMTTGTATGWSLVSQFGGASGIINYFKGGTGDTTTPPIKVKPEDEDEDPCKHADPVEIRTGHYTYDHDDLSIGSGEFPYRLTFQSQYSSRLRYSAGTMGLGWSHNWDFTIAKGSDVFEGLALNSPISGAASIALIYAMVDLLSDNSLPVQRVVSVHEAAYWWIGQLSNNQVTATLPNGARKFTLLPDGTYNSLSTQADTLTLTGGLYKITTPQQEVMNFNAAGQLTSQVYPNGVTVTLAYTGGNLTSITNGMGRTLTLNYTSGKLSSVTDGSGRSVQYAYDGTSQLTQFTDALSQNYTFSYNSPGRMWKYFRPQNPLDACVINTYDSLDRIQSQVDILGHSYQFYLAGSRSEIIDPVGNKSVTYYDSRTDVIKQIDALGNATTYLMDGKRRAKRVTKPEGNYFEFVFDTKNNVLSRTRVAKSGSGLANIVESFTYDPLWNKVKISTDGRGNSTTMTYDAVTGNLLKIERPLVGGLIPTVLLAYNSRGQVTQKTDESGLVTQFTYSAVNETLSTIVVNPGISPNLNLTFSLGYNTVGDLTSTQDARLNITTFQFDNLRRQILRTESTPFSYQTQYGFDANDNMTSLKRQTGIVATPWQTYTWTYSKSDKKKTMTDPALNVWTWDYDGADRLWKETDAENRVTEYLYDSRDKLFQVKDATLTICETRLYTANGKVASVKDAKNNLTQYSFDGHDRLDKTTFPDATFEQNQLYDQNSNVLTYRVRTGNTIVMTYDVLDRPSTKAPQGEPTISYVYDLSGRLLEANTPVIAGDPSSGSHKRAYDTAKRFIREEYPDGKQVTFQLDGNANITKLTYPDGYFVDRAYDQLNRLTTIKLNGAAAASATFSNDQLSRRSSLTFANGTSATYGLQLNNDLTSLAQSFVGASVNLTYVFNKVHEMTTQQVSDSTYMWHPSAAATTTYLAANNLNEYPKVGTKNYSYSLNGCLTNDGTWSYGYDTENHLLSASKTGTSVAYLYDPFHRQTQKAVTTTSTTKTRYIYSGWQRIADYNGTTGALQNRYVYGVGLDEPIIQVSSGGTRTFFHANHQGSIIARTNNRGAVTNKYKYGAFGETPALSGTTFGYTGQRYDSESGLYYYKRRQYAPAIGRFLQPDPLGYDLKIDGSCGCACIKPCGGNELSRLNLYAYTENNPLNRKDSMGLLATHPTESEPESGDLTDEQILCLIGAALALTACLATCVDPCPEENEKCIADCNLKYVLRVASCLSGSGFGFDDEE
jgi:RHS repeat-associated protein